MKYAKPEQKQQTMESEAASLELQLDARIRDKRFWERVGSADLSAATAHDSRIANNHKDEVRQNLANVERDIVMLTTKLAVVYEELEELSPKSEAGSSAGDS